MATMLNGAAIMDGALLLIAGNESCPQPQTSEHLAAVEIMRLQHIIILQNKVDLIQESAAINQHESIQKFIMVNFQLLHSLNFFKQSKPLHDAQFWLISHLIDFE